MSGTSLDGIDAVLVNLSNSLPLQLATHYQPFDSQMRSSLMSLHLPLHNEIHQAQLTGNELARLYASSVQKLLVAANLSSNDIVAIGCHGQTIRHSPEQGYTIQLGNGALLAELSGITVVNDFRSRDIAAGGQGAPLVPAFHDKVFRHINIHRVIVNIGGISNLTNIPPHEIASGFDCGPGNLLMDEWCMRHLSTPYDHNGDWAASGKVIPYLLEQMLNDPFFSLLPPKSTGRDLFNAAWLEKKLDAAQRAEDVQATLLELTSQTISQAIQQYCVGAKEVYLCGGGAHNRLLHSRLIALLSSCSVATTDLIDIDADFLEAIAFAWLAQQTIHGKAGNLPSVTGAKHSCILGAIHQT